MTTPKRVKVARPPEGERIALGLPGGDASRQRSDTC